VKQLVNDGWAVCFFNRGEDEWQLNFNCNDIPEIRATGSTFSVYDLWQHKTIAKTTKKNLVSTIPSHGVLMVKLTKSK
jgi:alpha-galactosidase